MAITVVGLGPGDSRFLTIEALEALKLKQPLFFRTDRHPVVETLISWGITYESYDAWYEAYDDFDQLYAKIAEDLVERGKNQDITYAVPGNPFVAEKTVEHLLNHEMAGDISLSFVYGVSFIDAMLTALKRDPVRGLKIIDALNMESTVIHHDTDMIFIQCYDAFTASEIKLKLADTFADDALVYVVTAAGVKGQERIEEMHLHDLDRKNDYNHLSSIFVPKPLIKDRYLIEDLLAVMKALRSDEGCPWDRVQTHETLRPYLAEEAYEVIDAIDRQDFADLEEELGDLLLQIAFHAQIASENGDFTWTDITHGICSKLIRRHPHVFSNWEVDSAEQVLVNWEAIKRDEKQEAHVFSSMERIPKILPQLTISDKIQKKAAKVGFDWPNIEGAFEKIHEEIAEIHDAMIHGDDAHIQEEIGDLLFAVVNCARFLKVDPEMALKMTNQKFITRFRFVEQKLAAVGKRLEDSTLEEMDEYWNASKKYE